MASAYDKASLVMLPNAYKDGKVYSVKPEDRSGDFTFTRPTSATRVAENGYIEKERGNVLLQSNSFNSAPWSTSSSDATIGQSGYDGTNDAWLLSKTAINGRAQQNISTSGVQTVSVYAKAGTKNWTNLRIDGGPSVYFDLQNGVLGSASGNISANIESVGNGFYRCSVAFNATISRVRIYVADNNNDTTGTSGNIIIQDAQLEKGLVATDYIETTTSAVYGGITDNVPRLDYTDSSCPALLLEPLRSNLVTQSEYFETSEWNTPNVVFETNKAISPDGGLNATKFRANSANSTHWASTDVTLTSGQDYTFKLYVKSAEYDWVQISLFGTGWVGSSKKINFNASTGEFGTTDTGIVFDSNPMGNGWHEVFITNEAASTSGVIRVYPMPSDNATSYQGDGSSGLYIFGAQLEQGSYPTSYIPTYGSSVSRVAETCSKNGISSLIGQSEGVFYWEGQNIGDSFAPYIGLFADAPNNNSTRIMIYYASKTSVQVQVRLSGVVQFLSDTATVSGNTKVAIGYKENDFVLYVNGVKISESSSGSTFTNELTTFNFNSAICKSEQILLFKTRLSNAELAALTTI